MQPNALNNSCFPLVAHTCFFKGFVCFHILISFHFSRAPHTNKNKQWRARKQWIQPSVNSPLEKNKLLFERVQRRVAVSQGTLLDDRGRSEISVVSEPGQLGHVFMTVEHNKTSKSWGYLQTRCTHIKKVNIYEKMVSINWTLIRNCIHSSTLFHCKVM